MRLATQAFVVAGFLGAGFAPQAQTIQVPMQLVDATSGHRVDRAWRLSLTDAR
jgi:hypothetical protein